MAVAGGMLKTNGISMASVAVGPRPGRTPIRVPTRQPTRAISRFMGWRATANPFRRCSNMGLLLHLSGG